jgi:hypothetical protein
MAMRGTFFKTLENAFATTAPKTPKPVFDDVEMLAFSIRLGYESFRTQSSDCDFEMSEFIRALAKRWAKSLEVHGARGNNTEERQRCNNFYNRMYELRRIFHTIFPSTFVAGRQIYSLGLVGLAFRYCTSVNPPRAHIERGDERFKTSTRVVYDVGNDPKAYFISAAKAVMDDAEAKVRRTIALYTDGELPPSVIIRPTPRDKHPRPTDPVTQALHRHAVALLGYELEGGLDPEYRWTKMGIEPIDLPQPKAAPKTAHDSLASFMDKTRYRCVKMGLEAYRDLRRICAHYSNIVTDVKERWEMHYEWASDYHLAAALLSDGIGHCVGETIILPGQPDVDEIMKEIAEVLWHSHYYAAVYGAMAGSVGAAAVHYQKAHPFFQSRFLPTDDTFMFFVVQEICALLLVPCYWEKVVEIVSFMRRSIAPEHMVVIGTFLRNSERAAMENRTKIEAEDSEKNRKREHLLSHLKLDELEDKIEFKRIKRTSNKDSQIEAL